MAAFSPTLITELLFQSSLSKLWREAVLMHSGLKVTQTDPGRGRHFNEIVFDITDNLGLAWVQTEISYY